MSNLKTVGDLVRSLPQQYIFSVETVTETPNPMFGDDFDWTQYKGRFPMQVCDRTFMSYHDSLVGQLAKDKPVVINDCIMIQKTLGKDYRCVVIDKLKNDTDIALLTEIQTVCMIRSVVEITELSKRSVQREIVTDLVKTFDPKSYKSKHRGKLLNKPLRSIDDLKITARELTVADAHLVTQLNDEWVETKCQDPGVFQMFIDGNGVKINRAIQHGKYATVLGYFVDGKLDQYSLYGTNGTDDVYDIFNVTSRGDRTVQTAIELFRMKYWYDLGYKTFNRGLELNKKLRAYKIKYPFYEVEYYQYARIKPAKAVESTFDNMFDF